jgi:hypothetical protein
MIKLSTQLVKSNFTISQAKQSLNLVDHIAAELDKFPNIVSLKLDPEFVRYVANMIENE